ncbi:MAG: helix-turn-helix domain-containing protein [Candidatus Rokubacteria bacterium]|nr:helix-turn-helix domain-containing protein [Candidatus Rokubacteria bacterium]
MNSRERSEGGRGGAGGDRSVARAAFRKKTAPGGSTALAPVPTLDELAGEPGQAAGLPLEAARALLARCAVVHGVLVARLLEAPEHGASAPQGGPEDRLLAVEEAAGMLAVSPDWLYRRAGRLPFTVRLGRTLRFSARGLERYIRQRQGRIPP